MNPKNLDTSQLHYFIQHGKWVEECKDEWVRRWAMEYPWYKNISGLQEYRV
jgi:hypothetical protein